MSGTTELIEGLRAGVVYGDGTPYPTRRDLAIFRANTLMRKAADALALSVGEQTEAETVAWRWRWTDMKADEDWCLSGEDPRPGSTPTRMARFAEVEPLVPASALSTLRRELDADADRIRRLQAALFYWMPSVSETIEIALNGRAGTDAYLLAGYDGPIDGPCWGDEIIARAEAAEALASQARADAMRAMREYDAGNVSSAVAIIRALAKDAPPKPDAISPQETDHDQ